jgi:histidine ammonia-lyase
MTVVLTGADLVIDAVVRVARDREPVSLGGAAISRMVAARAVVDRALARGDEVYGLTTGVGAAKTRAVEASDRSSQWTLVRCHLVGHGAALPEEVVRAATLVAANGFAAGWAGVRPEIATAYADALNAAGSPEIHGLGSVGQADLAQNAELTVGLLAELPLEPGEGLAVLSNNAFATAQAALAVSDAGTLLDALEAAGATSLEALGANLGMLHTAITDARGSRGLQTSLDALRSRLEGSPLWDAGAARNLQDPLTFRSLPQVLGAARDAVTYAIAQVAEELNAPQNNPRVLVDEDRIVSVASFDAQALATALDVARIGLAPAVLASSERAVKLLDTSWSGLARGLVGDDSDGLSFLAISGQALAAEAALLASPVSFQLASTAHAEGIEDRTALASLAARRLHQMVDLGCRIVATELVVAAQAIDLRGAPIGPGVAAIRDLIRQRVPIATADAPEPPDLDAVVELVRSGLRPAAVDTPEGDTGG